MNHSNHHIAQFSEHLHKKGFSGRFELHYSGKYPLLFQKLEDALEFHLEENAGSIAITHFELAYTLEHRSSTDFKRIVFSVDYEPTAGFAVPSYTIESESPVIYDEQQNLSHLGELPHKRKLLARFPCLSIWGRILRACRIIPLLLLIAGSSKNAKCQFFDQNGAMRRNTIQQIALLKTYGAYLTEGYKIVNKAITTVNDLKNGEFNLHRDFFRSLANINPKIARYARVGDILASQTIILNDCRKSLKEFRSSGWFSDKELEVMSTVFGNLMAQSTRNLSLLKDISTDGRLELTDDERIRRIDALWEQSQQQERFCLRFSRSNRLLAQMRSRDLNETNNLQSLYSNKPTMP